MKNTSQLFIEALENEGVEYIFGVPGEENLDFLNALKDSKIKLILTRHEQGAGFMAATYGRLTGKVGVCLSTLGPGATNLVTCAAYAQLGGMPICMITGQKPIKKSKQGRFQIIDVVEMMKPITKYTKQIVNGNLVPSIVRDAFRLALEERPGAVHLELPEDIASEAVDESVKTIPIHRAYMPYAEDAILDEAAKLIQNAKMPLLLIGAGANRKRISKSVESFIKQTGIWFFSTQMGKGIVNKGDEYSLGTASLSANDFIHHAIDKADLIINVGHDVIEKPPFFMEEGGKKVIHLNFFPAAIDEIYFPQVEVIGDIADSIERLGKKIDKNSNWDFSYFQKVTNYIRDHINKSIAKVKPDDAPTPQTLVQCIRDVLKDDDILTLDNGVYKIWFARNYIAKEPNTILLDNALATMGAGLPSAMMAKMIEPNKQVIGVCGDGGFMMNSQEMESAVRLGLDLVVVVIRDNSYGMIRWKQKGHGMDDFGLTYGNPEFVEYAKSYGANGMSVYKLKELKPTLQEALKQKGVTLVEVNIDYSENQYLLNEEFAIKPAELE